MELIFLLFSAGLFVNTAFELRDIDRLRDIDGDNDGGTNWVNEWFFFLFFLLVLLLFSNNFIFLLVGDGCLTFI